MIDPDIVLQGIRSELKDTVLPRLEHEYERTRVVAMLGILRDLAEQLRVGESRWRATNAELSASCEEAAQILAPDDPVAKCVHTLTAEAERAESPAAARAALLDAAQRLISAAWAPERQAARAAILATVRPALAGDLSAQTSRGAGG